MHVRKAAVRHVPPVDRKEDPQMKAAEFVRPAFAMKTILTKLNVPAFEQSRSDVRRRARRLANAYGLSKVRETKPTSTPAKRRARRSMAKATRRSNRRS